MGTYHLIACDERHEFISVGGANKLVHGTGGDKFDSMGAALWAAAAYAYTGEWNGCHFRIVHDSIGDEFNCIKDPSFNRDFGVGEPDYKDVTAEAVESARERGVYDP